MRGVGPKGHTASVPTAADRPIAAATIQLPSTLPDGSSTVDQDAEGRAACLRQETRAGFACADPDDSWPPADLAVSPARRSVIDPENGRANPEYTHRAVDAAATVGASVIDAASVGPVLGLEMYEDTCPGTADSAARIVTDVAHDAVGLNPDLGDHQVVTAPAYLEAGVIDHRLFPATLSHPGSTSPITCEHDGGDGLSVGAANREYLRRVLPV